MLANAKEAGYRIVLVYLHLDRPELHQARVGHRVGRDGHDVPDEKILSRLPRTAMHVGVAARIVDEIRLLDNSRIDDRFRPIAAANDGKIIVHGTSLPSWAQAILSTEAPS